MRWVRRIAILALVIGAMGIGWRFAAENQQPVRLHYVTGELPELALWKLVVGSFGAGAALVGLVALYTSARNGLISRRYRKAIGGLEAEVHQLRNLPLAPDSDVRAPGDASVEAALGRDG